MKKSFGFRLLLLRVCMFALKFTEGKFVLSLEGHPHLSYYHPATKFVVSSGKGVLVITFG